MICGRRGSPSLLFFSFIASLLHSSTALVHLRGDSFSFTFLDAPASFAVPIYGSGFCGSLHLASPVDACSPLRRNGTVDHLPQRFLLIARGECSFEKKVRIAQDAGFEAAIIYDDQEKNSLYSMIGDSWGIDIPAVFVSKMVGETLKKFAQGNEGECCIGPSADETAGAVLVISIVSLLAIVAVVAAFLFVRNCRLLRRANRSRTPSIMNRQALEALPCFIFNTTFFVTKHMGETCAICLEDYRDGDNLRVMPCLHEFHSACIDPWLTKWGSFCPVCKHEVNKLRTP